MILIRCYLLSSVIKITNDYQLSIFQCNCVYNLLQHIEIEKFEF